LFIFGFYLHALTDTPERVYEKQILFNINLFFHHKPLAAASCLMQNGGCAPPFNHRQSRSAANR
jgi:hypothetical protein